MKRFFMILLAAVGMLISLVACEKSDEGTTDNGGDDNSANIQYTDHLLALPDGLSEDGDHVHFKKTVFVKENDFNEKVVVVNTAILENELCVKAVSDYIFETEECADAYYEALMSGEGDIVLTEEEKKHVATNGSLVSIDQTNRLVPVGATRDKVRDMLLNQDGE